MASSLSIKKDQENKNNIISNIDKKLNIKFNAPTNSLLDLNNQIEPTITFGMDHNTILIDESKKLEEKIDEIIVWHPSGGLGHCLHNLSFVIQKLSTNDKNIKLFIYGLDTHVPFGEYFDTILEFKNKISYEEIKNINTFCTKYKLSNDDKNIIIKANYKTGSKKLTCTLDTNHNHYIEKIQLICSTWKYNIKNNIKLKDNYKNKILNNPLNYYKNNYNLIKSSIDKNSVYNTIEQKYTFRIKGSYMKALGVMNKHLKIEAADIKYSKLKKVLEMEYVDINNKNYTKKMIELTDHEIPNIKRIIKAEYGVLDKTVDVTARVKNYLLEKHDIELDAKVLEEQKNKIKCILQSEKYIAVHYRGRDKQADGGIDFKLKELQRAIKKYKIYNIYIATDNYAFFDQVYDSIKNINVFRYTSPPKDGRQIHYNKKDFKKGENLYKAILDVLMCKKATHFIPSKNSGFSTMVRELN